MPGLFLFRAVPLWLLALWASAFLAGCATGSPEPTLSGNGSAVANGSLSLVTQLPPPMDTNDGQDVPLGPGDKLEITVFQVKDLDRTVEVDNGGHVSLPLIGQIQAGGKTVAGLRKDIAERYGATYLQNPQVSVLVKESAAQKATVDGAVGKPGTYPVAGNATLLQVLAQAGGLTDVADESKIYVFRKFPGRTLVAAYDVRQIRAGRRADPRIYGGDVVETFKSGAQVTLKTLGDILGIAGRGAYIGAVL